MRKDQSPLLTLLRVIAPCFLGFTLSQGQTAPFEKTERGIKLRVGNAHVELAVADATALRLSISYQDRQSAVASTFLAPEIRKDATPWQIIHQDTMVGIASEAGRLLIDPQTGKWTLQNAQGAPLIPASDLGKPANVPTLDQAEVPGLKLELARKDGSPVQLYGSGNEATGLRQIKVRTHSGNGISVIPYYWSPGGYAVLAVTDDDNEPAFWSAEPSAVTWHFPGATADLYLMPAPTLESAARGYRQLSGAIPMPPLWSFGYLQSRWGWKDQADIEDALKHFRTLRIPVDAFIFDFEWYTARPDYDLPPEGHGEFDDFGWNPALFPEPARQLASYRKEGVHFVGIRKPRIGNGASLKEFNERDWMQQNQDGGYHRRDVDYANPAVRAWYTNHSEALLRAGVDGWWNDEGEVTYTTYYHWNEAEIAAQENVRPGTRFWSINRAFSPGVQRLGAAVWTGDITTGWKQLRRACTDLLNYSLAGMPYSSCDIGGFFLATRDSPPLSPELFTRWMQAGVFYPILRTHSVRDVMPHFPWLYGPEAQSALTKAINLRYRLLPYLYSLAHETHETGLPVMRPLLMDYPGDAKVADLSDQWTLGAGLMAAPILDEGATTRSVYLPPDRWYPFEGSQAQDGARSITATAKLDEIPLYVRAGTILPLAPVVQSTDELPGGPLDLQIYPGKDATFTLVEDDGKTNDYQKGILRKTVFTWNDRSRQLQWTTEGTYAGPHTFKQMVVTCFDATGVKRLPTALDIKGSVQIP